MSFMRNREWISINVYAVMHPCLVLLTILSVFPSRCGAQSDQKRPQHII